MKRIELSKEERRVLRETAIGCKDYPSGMHKDTYTDAVITLTEKGLLDSTIVCETVELVELTVKGRAYIKNNPHLLNPVNWTKIAAFAACIAAISATIALFISCSLINK